MGRTVRGGYSRGDRPPVIFEPTALEGAWRVRTAPIVDDRGSFARLFDAEEFAGRGLTTDFVQASLSRNPHPGTLRGLHFQAAPHGEVKLVRCTRGRLFDVLVDLRAESPSYGLHHAQILDAEEPETLYVPKGFAHGFLTLAPDTEVFYQMSTPYVPGAGRGVRWNDPRFAIAWPEAPRVISERDASYPDVSVVMQEKG